MLPTTFFNFILLYFLSIKKLVTTYWLRVSIRIHFHRVFMIWTAVSDFVIEGWWGYRIWIWVVFEAFFLMGNVFILTHLGDWLMKEFLFHFFCELFWLSHLLTRHALTRHALTCHIITILFHSSILRFE